MVRTAGLKKWFGFNNFTRSTEREESLPSFIIAERVIIKKPILVVLTMPPDEQ
jgi:hypothetical protein